MDDGLATADAHFSLKNLLIFISFVFSLVLFHSHSVFHFLFASDRLFIECFFVHDSMTTVIFLTGIQPARPLFRSLSLSLFAAVAAAASSSDHSWEHHAHTFGQT